MDPKTGQVAATEKPAQVTEQPKPTEAKMTPQYKAREEIARRREAERQEELKTQKFDVMDEEGNITPAEEKEEPKVEEEGVEAAVEEQLGEEQKEAPKEEAKEPEEEMRELIVDGKKISVSLSKILDAGVRTFQKETAADMRLAAASELERQARERFAQLQPPQPGVQQQPEVSDDDAALAKAIQFGSEEEAKAAISKLRNTARATTQQELRQFVESSQTNIPQQIEFYEATRWVKDEYKDLFSDPDMAQVFMNKEVAARQSGDRRPFKELYKALADDLSSKFGLKKETQPQNQDRVIRKAQAPKIASPAAGKTQAPPEKKQVTVADYVQRQRELRGLAPLPKTQGL